MGSIYLPYQKIPRWNTDRATVAYNCAWLGLSMPVLGMPTWEGAGDKVYDYSGKQHHGTIDGAVWQDSGLYFNGNDRVDCDLIVSEPFSLSIWYSTTYNIETTLVSVADKAETNEQHRITINGNGNLRASTYDDMESVAEDPSVTNDGRFHHAVAVFENSSSRKIYSDGLFRAVNTDNRTVTGVDRLTVGVSADSTPFGFFSGALKNVVLFKTALIPTQIQILYNNPFGMFEPIRSFALRSIPAAGISMPLVMQQMNQFNGGQLTI